MNKKALRPRKTRRGKTPTRHSYENMISRCHNPKATGYERYGGAGITVCDRWRESFSNFLEDMGTRPPAGKSLDRIENSKGYYKENCRWANRQEQARNRKTNKIIFYEGKDYLLTDLAKHVGIDEKLLRTRLHQGFELEFAIQKINYKTKKPIK